MNKTLLTTALAALIASASANAMDLNVENVSTPAPYVASVNATASKPMVRDSGFYIGVDAVKGSMKADSFSYTLPGNGGPVSYPVANEVKSASTSGYGVNVGYQDTQINSSILQALQIKRISYGLEFDQNSSHLQGTTDLVGTPGTLSADYKSSALFAMLKVNVFQVWHFSPYIEGGVGYMQQQVSDYQDNLGAFGMRTFPTAKTNGVASQWGAGMDLFVADHVTVSAGYRYVNASQLTIVQQSTTEASGNLNASQSQWLVRLDYDF